LARAASSAASKIRVASPKEATVTVQTRLDDVSPPIVGSHVGDIDSATSDEPSSPLVHKTSGRLRTPGAGPPAAKPPKVGTRVRSMGSIFDDTGAKGIPHRRERPEDIIRKSYVKSGLDASRLIITHEPHTTHPLALYMGSIAKSRSELTHGRSKSSAAQETSYWHTTQQQVTPAQTGRTSTSYAGSACLLPPKTTQSVWLTL
ncbi:hypothetical protein LTR74_018410, partial [Friedmanniomyces endolithicus]